MGNVYNSLTHTSLAAAAYAWAASVQPDNPDYLCNLAGAVQRQVSAPTSHPAKPHRYSRKPLHLHSHHPSHFVPQDASKALALYQRVIALKPVFPEAHNNVANLYR
jgi:hypothetical protein